MRIDKTLLENDIFIGSLKQAKESPAAVKIVTGHGKTTFGNEYSKQFAANETVWINEYLKIFTGLHFRFDENTKLVIIDNILDSRDMLALYNYFSSGKILIERKKKISRVINVQVLLMGMGDLPSLSFLPKNCHGGLSPEVENLQLIALDLPF